MTVTATRTAPTARLPALRPIAGALRLAEGLAVRYSDAVAPVCDALARMAEAHQPRRVVMLRDVSLLGRKPDGEGAIGRGADVRAELGPRAGAGPVAMYVGSLERHQGIDLLLEAFALAARRVPALTLAIVGGRSQDITRYEQLAVRLGVGARVRFLGPRPVERLGDYLADADDDDGDVEHLSGQLREVATHPSGPGRHEGRNAPVALPLTAAPHGSCSRASVSSG